MRLITNVSGNVRAQSMDLGLTHETSAGCDPSAYTSGLVRFIVSWSSKVEDRSSSCPETARRGGIGTRCSALRTMKSSEQPNSKVTNIQYIDITQIWTRIIVLREMTTEVFQRPPVRAEVKLRIRNSGDSIVRSFSKWHHRCVLSVHGRYSCRHSGSWLTFVKESWRIQTTNPAFIQQDIKCDLDLAARKLSLSRIPGIHSSYDVVELLGHLLVDDPMNRSEQFKSQWRFESFNQIGNLIEPLLRCRVTLQKRRRILDCAGHKFKLFIWFITTIGKS